MSNAPRYYFLTLPIPESLDFVGSLSTTPSYAVILWCHHHRFTGRLILEREKRVKHLFFSAGDLVAVRSNLIMEGIDMVLKKGFLDPAYVVQLQQDVVSGTLDEDWEDRMVYRVLTKEAIPEERLRDALEIQMVEQFVSALGWMDGKYFLKSMDTASPRYEFHPFSIPLRPFFETLDRYLKNGTPLFVPPKVHEMVADNFGELGLSGGATIIARVSARKGDGKLVFRRGRKRKDFLFRDGKIFSVSTSDPKETLENVLERWGFLPRDIIQSVAGQARISGSRLRNALITQKLLQENELSLSLRILHLERIFEAFSWRSGHYEWLGHDSAGAGEEKEERTNAESSRNIRTYSDVIQELSRYTHKKHVLLLEAAPLKAVERNQILEDFLETAPKTLSISFNEQPDALRVSDRSVWTRLDSDHHLDVSGSDYRGLAPALRDAWQAELASRFDQILWFSPAAAVPSVDNASAFLLLPKKWLGDPDLGKTLAGFDLPPLEGYFTIDP